MVNFAAGPMSSQDRSRLHSNKINLNSSLIEFSSLPSATVEPSRNVTAGGIGNQIRPGRLISVGKSLNLKPAHAAALED